MPFEWVAQKDAANFAKHDVDVPTALMVFTDPLVLDLDSTRPGDNEVRRKAIGWVDGVMLTVIYTDRPIGRGIISARRAR